MIKCSWKSDIKIFKEKNEFKAMRIKNVKFKTENKKKKLLYKKFIIQTTIIKKMKNN